MMQFNPYYIDTSGQSELFKGLVNPGQAKSNYHFSDIIKVAFNESNSNPNPDAMTSLGDSTDFSLTNKIDYQLDNIGFPNSLVNNSSKFAWKNFGMQGDDIFPQGLDISKFGWPKAEVTVSAEEVKSLFESLFSGSSDIVSLKHVGKSESNIVLDNLVQQLQSLKANGGSNLVLAFNKTDLNTGVPIDLNDTVNEIDASALNILKSLNENSPDPENENVVFMIAAVAAGVNDQNKTTVQGEEPNYSIKLFVNELDQQMSEKLNLNLSFKEVSEVLSPKPGVTQEEGNLQNSIPQLTVDKSIQNQNGLFTLPDELLAGTQNEKDSTLQFKTDLSSEPNSAATTGSGADTIELVKEVFGSSKIQDKNNIPGLNKSEGKTPASDQSQIIKEGVAKNSLKIEGDNKIKAERNTPIDKLVNDALLKNQAEKPLDKVSANNANMNDNKNYHATTSGGVEELNWEVGKPLDKESFMQRPSVKYSQVAASEQNEKVVIKTSGIKHEFLKGDKVQSDALVDENTKGVANPTDKSASKESAASKENTIRNIDAVKLSEDTVTDKNNLINKHNAKVDETAGSQQKIQQNEKPLNIEKSSVNTESSAADKESSNQTNAQSGNDSASTRDQRSTGNDRSADHNAIGPRIESVKQNENIDRSFNISKDTSHVDKRVDVGRIFDEVATYIKDGNKKSITLAIDPENLGHVKLSIEASKNMVNAKVEVENVKILQMFQNNSDILKNMIQQNGIQLNSLSVSIGSSQEKAQSYFKAKKKENDLNSTKGKVEDVSTTYISKKLGYNTYDYII